MGLGVELREVDVEVGKVLVLGLADGQLVVLDLEEVQALLGLLEFPLEVVDPVSPALQLVSALVAGYSKTVWSVFQRYSCPLSR